MSLAQFRSSADRGLRHKLDLVPVTLGDGEHGSGQSLAVNRFPCIVGRNPDCDCRILLPDVSRHHCRFLRLGGNVWVEDLVSHNGTFLNGRRVTAPEPLRDGDWLNVGTVRFRVRLVA